jgi:transcriptional regulator with XRE-family HTH domain
MNIIKRLREVKGLTHRELAKVAGINVESYYDLEQYDDELDRGVSVGGIARIAKELGVRPSIFYAGTSGGAVSTGELALLIRKRLELSGKALPEFETQVGYEVATALDNPDEFQEFDADSLRAVCAAVGVNWFDVLDHLVEQ